MPEILIPETPELTFDDATHTYRLDGAIIPSVTEVMKPLTQDKYDGIPEATLDRAAHRGTSVHNAIENYLKYDIVDIPDEFRGYFDAFMGWFETVKPVVIASEIKTYHKLMQYGGTIDLLCMIEDELTMIDYKTTAQLYEMTCGVQLEAYDNALATHGVKVAKKRILHLKSDGRWKDPVFPKSAVQWKAFASMKCVYDYIQSYK